VKNKSPITISPKWLLSIHACVFVAICLALVDSLLLGGMLKRALPNDPNDFIIFYTLFTLPHIIASFFCFFDTEYREHYGAKLLTGAQLCFVSMIILSLFGKDRAFYILAALTMTHVLFQQVGVAKSLMRVSSKQLTLWKWLAAAISTIIYIDLYTSFSINKSSLRAPTVILMLVLSVLAAKIAKSSKTQVGAKYFWMTHIMAISSIAFYWFDYSVLAIAVPRIVHDLTGYMYYVAHDHNRYLRSPTNLLYRTLNKVSVPVILASPLLSVGFASILQYKSFAGFLLPLTTFLILLHYHTERYIWKSGSLHRQQIKI
jgi:hypothetical protein